MGPRYLPGGLRGEGELAISAEASRNLSISPGGLADPSYLPRRPRGPSC